jgi:hypothetical protein
VIQRPSAVGLFICETVIVEEHTHNVTPVNCYRRRVLPHFPTGPFPLVVFAVLTDGIGETRGEVRVRHLAAEPTEELFRIGFTARFPDPLHEVRCVVPVLGRSFPAPGASLVDLLIDKQVVAWRRFELVAPEGAP